MSEYPKSIQPKTPTIKDPRKCPIPRYSRTYNTWRGMVHRCTNENNKWHWKYKEWFYPPWVDFQVFLKDMGERPEDTTLDRVDNSKGYSPENCRWATHKEQQRNKSNIKMNMETAKEIRELWATKEYTVKELANRYGTYTSMISSVLHRGCWS